MKRIYVNAFGVAVLSVTFVYLWSDPLAEYGSAHGQPSPAEVKDHPGSQRRPAVPPAADATAPAPRSDRAQRADLTAIKHRLGVTYDPMLVMGLGDFTDAEIDAYNELHVLPFNPAVGEDCRELPDPQFPGQDFQTCKTLRERPEHPYNDLADEDLRYLAVHEPVASLLLGRRALAEEERLYWHLRAAALAEKSGPLLALAERRYGSAYGLQAVAGQVTPVAQPEAMITRLALETVAGKLGDPRANPQRWREALLRAAGEQSAEALARADGLVMEFLTSMADAQRRVTGSVQIQEIIDA